MMDFREILIIDSEIILNFFEKYLKFFFEFSLIKVGLSLSFFSGLLLWYL